MKVVIDLFTKDLSNLRKKNCKTKQGYIKKNKLIKAKKWPTTELRKKGASSIVFFDILKVNVFPF